jgi:hypothetical protein
MQAASLAAFWHGPMKRPDLSVDESDKTCGRRAGAGQRVAGSGLGPASRRLRGAVRSRYRSPPLVVSRSAVVGVFAIGAVVSAEQAVAVHDGAPGHLRAVRAGAMTGQLASVPASCLRFCQPGRPGCGRRRVRRLHPR